MDEILPSPEIQALNEIYSDLDRQIEALKGATGLQCAPGCGACCLRPTREIEATVLEMLPVAHLLWSQGRGEEILAQARSAGPESPCVFFQADPLRPWGGRCSQYAFRPLICRLFGFSGVRDKQGALRLTYSKVMKSTDPDMISRAQEILQSKNLVPAAGDFGERVRQLHPVLSSSLYPLNLAIEKALEWVLLRARWYRAAGSGVDSLPA